MKTVNSTPIPSDMTPEEKREWALKRLEEERAFYTHLITYVG